MDPLTIGLITGGANLLGSIFSSDTSAQNTQANIQAQKEAQLQTQDFNAGQSQLNRDFQQQMSSTAYQRSSADMKAAGLNPMMMFGSGSAASTPGGSSASVSTPNMALSNKTSPLANLGQAASSVVSSAVQAKTMDKMTDEIAKLQAERGLTTATTDVRKQELATEKEETFIKAQENQRRSLAMPASRFSAKQAEDLLDMDESARRAAMKAGWYSDKAGKIVDLGAGLISSATKMRGMMPRRSTTETTRDDGPSSFTERYQY